MTLMRVLVLAVALVTVAAGCGGSSSTGDAGTTTAAAGESEAESVTAEDAGSSETFDRDNYALLISDPDAHKGADVTIVGRIFNEVEQDADGTYFQMWANPKDSEWNTIVGVADPSLRLSDGDYVRVIGTVTGEFRFTENGLEDFRDKDVRVRELDARAVVEEFERLAAGAEVRESEPEGLLTTRTRNDRQPVGTAPR